MNGKGGHKYTTIRREGVVLTSRYHPVTRLEILNNKLETEPVIF